MALIAPSILSADFSKLGEQMRLIDECGADFFHIDVMDGTFVPNISFGIPIITSVRPITKVPFDVHLMIQEPVRYVRNFANAGADIITVHYEACSNIMGTIAEIKSVGKKCGVALKPGTPIDVIDPFMDKLDLLLIMGVEPGFGGQKLNEKTYNKVRTAKEKLASAGLAPLIEIDGGVRPSNVKDLIAAGCDIIVTGSAAFMEPIKESMSELVKLIK